MGRSADGIASRILSRQVQKTGVPLERRARIFLSTWGRAEKFGPMFGVESAICLPPYSRGRIGWRDFSTLRVEERRYNDGASASMASTGKLIKQGPRIVIRLR